MRVTRSRELVAEGDRPSVVARVAQISRQAIYRTARPRRAPAPAARAPADEVEAAIVEIAVANPTDGYRIVTALARRRLGRAVNRKRTLRVMRQRRLIQRRRRLECRRRPGFFRVERPDQLWHLDMTWTNGSSAARRRTMRSCAAPLSGKTSGAGRALRTAPVRRLEKPRGGRGRFAVAHR